MDLFSLITALVPMAVYLLVLGALHLRRRPYVQTGFADTMLLGMALSGMVLVGPLDLFIPETAAYRFGWFFRVLLVALYVLILLLVAISRRPRMVIYNVRFRDLRPAIEEVVSALDSSAHWSGRSAYLPASGVDFFIDPEPPSRTIQITALSRDISFTQWTSLRRNLARSLRSLAASPNPKAAWLIGGGVAMLLFAAALCVRDFPAMAQSFHEWLVR
jgi:hypothetical protein